MKPNINGAMSDIYEALKKTCNLVVRLQTAFHDTNNGMVSNVLQGLYEELETVRRRMMVIPDGVFRTYVEGLLLPLGHVTRKFEQLSESFELIGNKKVAGSFDTFAASLRNIQDQLESLVEQVETMKGEY